jgi:hypothetical protein
MVSVPPNLAHVIGRIEQELEVDSTWGAWANLFIEQVTDVPGQANYFQDVKGKRIRVFVPPPLVEQLTQVPKQYDGHITYRGGFVSPVYALVPPSS